LRSTATGQGAQATDDRSTATGQAAQATGFASTATGQGAQATGLKSTASGHNAQATGKRSTATGTNAQATGFDSTATGVSARATGVESTATGQFSQAAGDGSTATGRAAQATATGSTAIGAQSRATATNSVALGRNSVADEANTVSVGSPGRRRRITNVADGVNAFDAVNVRQLNTVQAAINANFDRMAMGFNSLDNRVDNVGALSSAFSAMTPNPRDNGRTQISMGMGFYKGKTAMAGGVYHYVNDRVLLNTGMSFAGSESSGRFGMTIGFGSH
jgi:autotransporter adhesin